MRGQERGQLLRRFHGSAGHVRAQRLFDKAAQCLARANFQDLGDAQLTQAAEGILHVNTALHLLFQQRRDGILRALFMA